MRRVGAFLIGLSSCFLVSVVIALTWAPNDTNPGRGAGMVLIEMIGALIGFFVGLLAASLVDRQPKDPGFLGLNPERVP